MTNDSPDGRPGVVDALHEHRAKLIALVDEQIDSLNALGVADTIQLFTRDAALLGAKVRRESDASTLIAMTVLWMRVEDAAKAIDGAGERIDHLASRIDAFSKETEATSRQMAHWTKVMGWTSVALAFFAVAQILGAIFGLFDSP